MQIFARPKKMHKPRTGCIDDNLAFIFTYSLPGRGYSKYWMQVSYNKFALPVYSVFSFITCKIIARILPKVWELINHSVTQHFPHKLFCKCFLLRSTIIRHNNQLTRSISFRALLWTNISNQNDSNKSKCSSLSFCKQNV